MVSMLTMESKLGIFLSGPLSAIVMASLAKLTDEKAV